MQNCVYLLGKQVRTQGPEFGCQGPTHLPGLTLQPRARVLHAADGPLHMHFLKSPGVTHFGVLLIVSCRCPNTFPQTGQHSQEKSTLTGPEAGSPKSRCPRATLPPQAPSCPFPPLGTPGLPGVWPSGCLCLRLHAALPLSVSSLLSLIWTPVTGLRANLDIPR